MSDLEEIPVDKINVRNKISFFEQKIATPNKNNEVSKLKREFSLRRSKSEPIRDIYLPTTQVSTSAKINHNILQEDFDKIKDLCNQDQSKSKIQSKIVDFLCKLVRSELIDDEKLRLVEAVEELNVKLVEKPVNQPIEIVTNENVNEGFKPKVDKLKSFFEKMTKENEDGLNLIKKDGPKTLGRSKSMHALSNSYLKYTPPAKLTRAVSVEGKTDDDEGFQTLTYNDDVEAEFERLAKEAEEQELYDDSVLF